MKHTVLCKEITHFDVGRLTQGMLLKLVRRMGMCNRNYSGLSDKRKNKIRAVFSERSEKLRLEDACNKHSLLCLGRTLLIDLLCCNLKQLYIPNKKIFGALLGKNQHF